PPSSHTRTDAHTDRDSHTHAHSHTLLFSAPPQPKSEYNTVRDCSSKRSISTALRQLHTTLRMQDGLEPVSLSASASPSVSASVSGSARNATVNGHATGSGSASVSVSAGRER